MKYKLIALDLDGTLKNSKNEISPRTKEALMKAQEMGCHIVLASGRPTPGLRHDSATLELDKHNGYLLSYNGARVLNATTKETRKVVNYLYSDGDLLESREYDARLRAASEVVNEE